MLLCDLAETIPNFDSLKQREKILLFGWYLHTYARKESFGNKDIRSCFNELHLEAPNVGVYLPRMLGADLLKIRSEYSLSRRARQPFDEKFLGNKKQQEIRQILRDLPKKVPDIQEKQFLSETMNCYGCGAYRATIVMAWSLAFSHFVNWILHDAKRLQTFNDTIPRRFPKRTGVKISTIEDFEEFKESEVIEIASTAKLMSKNIAEILREKLKKRNIAAHPSKILVVQSQADDVVTDLVNNIILKL